MTKLSLKESFLMSTFAAVAGSVLTIAGMNMYQRSAEEDLHAKGYRDIRINVNDTLTRTLQDVSWDVAEHYHEAKDGPEDEGSFAVFVNESDRRASVIRTSGDDSSFEKSFSVEFGGTFVSDGKEYNDTVGMGSMFSDQDGGTFNIKYENLKTPAPKP